MTDIPNVPHDAETASISAMLGDPFTIEQYVHYGLAPTDWGGEKTGPVAEACFLVRKAGKTVDRANVAEQLRLMNRYGDGKLITPAYLRQLDREGVPSLVERALQYAEAILTYSVARRLAIESGKFETHVRMSCQRSAISRQQAEDTMRSQRRIGATGHIVSSTEARCVQSTQQRISDTAIV
jgi:hypothetical protein